MPVIIAFLTVFALSLPAFAQTGSASWYALDGNRTANGERMNSAKMTAAHRSLPFGTRVKVTNMRNGRSVVVRINDRGPFAKRRVLDLSKAAARKIGMLGRGHAKVRIAKVDRKTALGTAPTYRNLAKLARITLPTYRPLGAVAGLGDTAEFWPNDRPL